MAIVASAAMTPVAVDRVRAALWGVYIADSLSMPVHWYYQPAAIKKQFGRLVDYQAAPERHPGSIMTLSSTGGHGRGDQKGRIIGDIINHGKHDLWGKPGVHYHHGMQAGQNTLNALCARVVTRGVAAEKGYSQGRFLEDYIKFMTTPGSHDDTYAESFHRDFFKNWVAGVAPEQCARGTEGHNTASIGGFVMLPPVILGMLPRGVAQAKAAALQHLALTHESAKLAQYAEVYTQLLADVVGGRDLREAILTASKAVGVDVQKVTRFNYTDVEVVHQMFGSACYITDSFPSVLYLAFKYADSFEDAVLANTNVGGENCHRGSALGAIMGAAAGMKGIPDRFITGLRDSKEISNEIDSFIHAVYETGSP